MTSRFSHIKLAGHVEAFALAKACDEDPYSKKANLGIGVYRNENGEPVVLPCVKEAELRIADDDLLDHDYLPASGLENFSKSATCLLMGAWNSLIISKKAFGIQAMSGTGAIRLGAEFLSVYYKYSTFYVSDPPWENYVPIFKFSGFKHAKTYKYWDRKARVLDIKGMMEDLNNAPEYSVIILQLCGHNPTGCDPTKKQWKQLCQIISKRKLFPFFDAAYQGFTSGDPDSDAWSVRYFASKGLELFCAQSFSKSFGLYDERVGNLTCVVNSRKNVPKIKEQLASIAEGLYLSPICHGARTVGYILNNQHLFAEWKDCLKTMSTRILDMRQKLRLQLEERSVPGPWEHITRGSGLLLFLGLNEHQVEYLIFKKHIYLLKNSRINVCGLNDENIDYVVDSIAEAFKLLPDEVANDKSELCPM